MKSLYHFHDKLVLRTPDRPFLPAFDEQDVQNALADEKFMEAIYLASPVLRAECGKWQGNQLTEVRKIERLRYTLTRYYTRFMSRCTPFGLFAGCSVLEWGKTNQLLIRPDQHDRHTRLDMSYLCALARRLADRAGIRRGLLYRPNTSFYRLGCEIRYIERYYGLDGRYVHQISAIEASEAIEQVLALSRQGCTLSELATGLLGDATDTQEVNIFLEALVESQLLVSELEPTVTGDEFLCQILAVLNRLATASPFLLLPEVVNTLTTVQQSLTQLDKPGINNVSSYEHISELLAPLGAAIEADKLFQTDAHHSLSAGPGPDAKPATLDAMLQNPLMDAITVLYCFSSPYENQRLNDFIHRFQLRYGEQAVPLLEALDTESGLHYTEYGTSRYSSLVSDLVLPEATGVGSGGYPIPLNAAQQWLRLELSNAEHTQSYSLEASVAALHAAGLIPNALPLPPSVGVLFRLLGNDQLLLESVGGSSAVNLLGRFAHSIPGVELLIKEVTAFEQTQNPSVKFAEIGHLPTNRIGNLLQRPHFRDFEIPYLAQSTRPEAEQLPAQGLTLAVRDGQLVLRDSRTGQHIVPRLSTAHNFEASTMPVYQLLCDLQTQGMQSQLWVNWEDIAPNTRFLPRLTCGPIVLTAATWRLTLLDWQTLLTVQSTDRSTELMAFRTKWMLPRFFTLTDGDNELFVDADNELMVSVWLDAIRARTNIVLKEFLFDAATAPVRDTAGQPYVAQALALLLRQESCYAAVSAPLAVEDNVLRNFALGSQWLYYKFYCGQLVADRVLLDVIRPLTIELQARGLVNTWFFIRYSDPDDHLRVRWHLPYPNRVGEVIQLINSYLGAVSGSHSVWKIQTETYCRELERYGRRSIGAIEDLFSYQSQAVLDHMAQTSASGGGLELWPWGLGAIDELLSAFDYSLARKTTLIAHLRLAFAREFGMTKELKRKINAKYREQRVEVQRVLASVVAPPPALLATIQPLRNLARKNQLELPLDELLGSCIHMLLNRLLPADARLHELVLYDFLHRHYQSCQAR